MANLDYSKMKRTKIKDKIKISEFVFGLRLMKGQNIRDFAKDFSTSKALIGKYEAGYNDCPSVTVARNFCNIFNIPFDVFCEEFYYEDNAIYNSYEYIKKIKETSNIPIDELFDSATAEEMIQQQKNLIKLKKQKSRNN